MFVDYLLHNVINKFSQLLQMPNNIKLTKKQGHGKGQLFSNNHPDTTVHGYGFDTSEHINRTLADLNNRDIIYQFQVVNTLNERAKSVLTRTNDPSKQSQIKRGLKLLQAWLDTYHKKNRGQSENYSYLTVQQVNKLEPLAEYYNISRKARGLEKPSTSDEGFLTVYRRTTNPAKLRTMPVRQRVPQGETWDKHRNNFIKRRLLMLKNAGAGYGLYHTEGSLAGLPTVLHVNMLMWAFSPDKALYKGDKFAEIIKKINGLARA